jgi:quercetin dioxygenase-like cupin family protein
MHMMKMGVAFLLTSGALAIAQQMPMPMNAGDIKWGPAPNVLPAGAQMAVVSGDPSKDGLYVVRLKMPANYQIPAHNHPTTEYVTVLSGDFHIGMGDRLDRKKVRRCRRAVLPRHRLR